MSGYTCSPRYNTPSPDVLRKLELSSLEAENIETREMRCPICGFLVRIIPVTQTDIVFVCKMPEVQVRRSSEPCLFQENTELPGEQDAVGGIMKLRNVLIVVRDIERSRKYYHDLFGLETVLDNDGNMILSEGLVLQDAKIWENFLGKDIIPRNNASELYFEERDIEGFIQKLEELYPDTVYVNRLMTHSWGQRVVRFYDPDGNLIEVGTPME